MEIEVPVGENFIISLYSDPTTGYGWEAAYDSSFITLTKRAFYSQPHNPVGGGGLEAFEFEPYNAGYTEISMLYKRPWEKTPIERRVYKINIFIPNLSRPPFRLH